MLNRIMFIGSINIKINTTDIAINGILSNLGYLTLLIISIETIMLNNNPIYGLNKPLKYNVASINDIAGIGNCKGILLVQLQMKQHLKVNQYSYRIQGHLVCLFYVLPNHLLSQT